MASRIQELVVKITPDGVQETTEQLEEQAEQFEETAEAADEQTDDLERFSRNWKGAMATAAAGIAIAASALASKVPVLGTALAGVDAVMTSLGLQVDQFLRDAGLTGDTLFTLAERIDNLEGPAADAVGALTLLSSAIIGVGAAAGAAGLVTGAGFVGGVSALATKAGAAASGLASMAAGSTIAAGALGVLAGALGVGVLQQFGIIQDVRELGRAARQVAGGPLTDLVLTLGGLTGTLPLVAAAGAFVSGFLKGGFSKAVADATKVLQIFGNAARRTAKRVKMWIQDMIKFVNKQFQKLNVKPALRKLDQVIQRARQATRKAREAGVPTGGDVGERGGAGFMGPITLPGGVPGLQSGGLIEEGGLAFLHAGEQVVPAADVRSGDGGGGGGHAFAGTTTIEVPVRLNGEEIARAVGDLQSSGVNNRGRGFEN